MFRSTAVHTYHRSSPVPLFLVLDDDPSIIFPEYVCECTLSVYDDTVQFPTLPRGDSHQLDALSSSLSDVSESSSEESDSLSDDSLSTRESRFTN